MQQDLLARVAGELGLIARGDLEGLAGVRRGAGRDGADHFVGVRIAHLDDALGVDPAPGDAHGFVATDRGGGLGDGPRGLPYSAAAQPLAAARLRAAFKASKLPRRPPATPPPGQLTPPPPP